MEHYDIRYIPNGTQEILVADEVCWDAADWGVSTDYVFNAPYDGIISGVRLIHKSGGTICDDDDDYAAFGCGVNEYDWFYGDFDGYMQVQMVRIVNETTFYGETWYPKEGFTNDSTEFIDDCDGDGNHGCEFSGYKINWWIDIVDPSDTDFVWTNPSYNVTTEDRFMIVFGESCCGISLDDNDGTSCAQVLFWYDEIIYEDDMEQLLVDTTQSSDDCSGYMVWISVIQAMCCVLYFVLSS